MSKRIATALAALAAAMAIAGVALATPGSGITPTTHVDRATMADSVDLNNDRIKFQTKDPVDIRVQTLRMAPGATTGWHSHPGFVIVSITEGTQTLYSADCSSRTVSAGESFVETGMSRCSPGTRPRATSSSSLRSSLRRERLSGSTTRIRAVRSTDRVHRAAAGPAAARSIRHLRLHPFANILRARGAPSRMPAGHRPAWCPPSQEGIPSSHGDISWK
jgi:quercetin dioxygenase-like cupin family protein